MNYNIFHSNRRKVEKISMTQWEKEMNERFEAMNKRMIEIEIELFKMEREQAEMKKLVKAAK